VGSIAVGCGKTVLPSSVLAFAAFQLDTALWIFGKINRKPTLPKRLGIVRRASGLSVIVVRTLPRSHLAGPHQGRHLRIHPQRRSA
jgi:hypothetical protein